MTALLLAALIFAATQEGPAPVDSRTTAGPAIDTRVRAVLVADALPRRDVFELRPHAGLVVTAAPTDRVTASFDVEVDVLLASRGGRVTDVTAQVRDSWLEWRRDAVDVRGGFGRVVWGRLDEIAPTDVVNPLDTARFLFEGRAAARIAVPFTRVRFTPSERVQVEGVIVPFARRGVFDRLDESSSPFNLVTSEPDANGVDREQRMPSANWRNISGGARTQVTAGRVDVAASVYRGFDAIGPIVAEIADVTALPPDIRVVERHPRFTMVGVDAETVTGPWAWRGEIAAFVDRQFAAQSRLGLVAGKSLDAGIGFDRRVGELRVFGSALLHREWSDEDPSIDRAHVNLVASVERSFGRDRYLGRAFVVVNPGDASAFARGLFGWRVSDALGVELSAGAFLGTSDDNIGRFRTRDFLLAHIAYDF